MAAVNSSKAGDTILFSGGTFNFSGELDLPGDRNYLGANHGALSGHGGDGELVKIQGDNFSFKNLTFNGGGVFLDKSGGGFNTNVTFDHDTFNLNTHGTNPSGITATSGMSNAVISNNYFTGYSGGFGIYGYNYNGLKIVNNEFVDITAGIHIQAFNDSGNLLVQNNYIKGVNGMGMEFQGRANNLKFLDNFYEHPVLSSDPNRNTNSMAFSLPLDESSNIDIEAQHDHRAGGADGIGMRIGIETGGDNTLVQDNYINGVNCTIADTDGVGSSSVTIKNNRESNFLQKDTLVFPAGNHVYTNTNNGPNTQLTWDINRAEAGHRWRDGHSDAHAHTDSNADAHADSCSAAERAGRSDGVGRTGDRANKAALFWTDNANGETGYVVESSTDGKTWSKVATLAPESVSYTADDLTAGRELQLPRGGVQCRREFGLFQNCFSHAQCAGCDRWSLSFGYDSDEPAQWMGPGSAGFIQRRAGPDRRPCDDHRRQGICQRPRRTRGIGNSLRSGTENTRRSRARSASMPRRISKARSCSRCGRMARRFMTAAPFTQRTVRRKSASM